MRLTEPSGLESAEPRSAPNKPRPRACIATLDPRHRGGTLTSTRILYDVLTRNGWDPYLVYNSIDPEMHFPSRLRNTRRVTLSVRPEEFDGMKGFAVPLLLPQFEGLSYMLNFFQWRRATSGAGLNVVLGGGVQSGICFALGGVSFFCWVGTTIRSERSTQSRASGGWRFLRQRASDRLLNILERRTFRRAKLVLAQSASTQQDIVQLGVPSDRVELLSSPVDASFYHPLPFDRRRGDYVVLVARLSDPRKNVQLLLKALAGARRAGTDIPAVLVGRADPQLEEQCQQLGLSDLVKFTGYVEEAKKLSYLQNARFFVLPSRQEGFGLAAFEAMACGVPVVATRCGAVQDMIESGVDGLLVDNEDEAGLRAAILKLWDDTARCQSMGELARARIDQHLALPRIEGRLLEVINGLKINGVGAA